MAGRGSAPGERRGGRQKGTPNKVSLDVAAILAKMDCCPFKGMAEIAQDPNASLELRGRMLSELAQYIGPKRKAIEVSGPEGEPVMFKMIIGG